MIDIHNHILPMVDDGSSSIDMSLSMLDASYRHGTSELVLTPHFAYPYHFINPYHKISELFEDFKYIVESEGIPIKLYLGCEFLFDSIETFEEHYEEITHINDTKYLLMEFFFNVDSEFIYEAVEKVLSYGLIPIIAHPERYECIQVDNDVPMEIVKRGGLLQMNKGSLFNKYGDLSKEAVLSMLDHHLISFIGSDAHHPVYRDSKIDRDYDYIYEYYGKEYVEDIFYNNPERMLKDIDIRGKRI